MILAALLVLLFWDAVTTDCHGAPMDGVTYEIAEFTATVAGAVDCGDGSTCPVYARQMDRWQVAQPPVLVPALPDPPPAGGVTMLEVTAEGPGGARSDDQCR